MTTHTHDGVNVSTPPDAGEVVDAYVMATHQVEPCLSAMATLFGWPLVTPVAQVIRNVQDRADVVCRELPYYEQLSRELVERRDNLLDENTRLSLANAELRTTIIAAPEPSEVVGLQAQVAELERLLGSSGRGQAWVTRTVRRGRSAGAKGRAAAAGEA